ncbi:MAG TPA: hypothetical protein VHL59_02300 [Thermoanaerobaculia bacterium]|nr:hypothetical protein [Thermoanaerobaculia bacterium]
MSRLPRLSALLVILLGGSSLFAQVTPAQPTTLDEIFFTVALPCPCCFETPTVVVNGNQIAIDIRVPPPDGSGGCGGVVVFLPIRIGRLPAGTYTVTVTYGSNPPSQSTFAVVQPATVPLLGQHLLGALAGALAGIGYFLSRRQ